MNALTELSIQYEGLKGKWGQIYRTLLKCDPRNLSPAEAKALRRDMKSQFNAYIRMQTAFDWELMRIYETKSELLKAIIDGD